MRQKAGLLYQYRTEPGQSRRKGVSRQTHKGAQTHRERCNDGVTAHLLHGRAGAPLVLQLAQALRVVAGLLVQLSPPRLLLCPPLALSKQPQLLQQ